MSPEHIANAMGPEVAQAAQARAAFAGALVSGAVPMGDETATADVDRRNPQVWNNRPNVLDAINTTAAGDETARESLPGRLSPSEWDGDPGWMAAIGGGDW